MNRLAVAALVLCTSCLHGSSLFHNRSQERAEAAADSIYWSAIAQLVPTNKNGSRDTAVTLLDAYLKSAANRKHLTEATTLLALARDAQQLARVQAALAQARSEVRESNSGSTTAGARDEGAVKEIERLKGELARANEELDRIKKRLATPPPQKP